MRNEIEQFFCSSILGTGKTIKLRGWQDADVAAASLRKGIRAFRRKRVR